MKKVKKTTPIFSSEKRSKARKVKYEMAVILFADIINSAVLADILPLERYTKLIQKYHDEAEKAYNTVFPKRDVLFKCVGDEVMLIIPYDEGSSSKSDQKAMLNALRFARLIKLRWHLIKRNQDRIREGKRPFEVGIGINVGGGIVSGDPGNFVGHAVVLAKRVETSSREGAFTKIMLSRTAYQKALESEARLLFSDSIQYPLKGFMREEPIFEVKSYFGYIYWDSVLPLWKDPGDFLDLFKFDSFNTWLGLELAIALYYRAMFEEAIDILKKVLVADPQLSIVNLLLGECYFNLAMNEKDPGSQKFFFKRAISKMKEAIYLEKSEDMYIQLGLVYFSKLLLLKELANEKEKESQEKTIEKFKKRIQKNFKKATECGRSSERAIYWMWIFNKIQDKDYSPFDLLFEAGWIPTPSGKEKDLRKVAKEHAEAYIGIIFLENYLANVYFSIGIVYSDLLKEPSKKEALEWLKKALTLAEKIREESDLGKGCTHIYSSTLRGSYLQNPTDFIENIKTCIGLIKEGKKILPLFYTLEGL
jgi:class 3 adenylate cyclase